MNKIISLFLALALVSACADPGADTPRVERLKQEISAFQSDPETIRFLAEEAARAGVPSIKFLSSNRTNIHGITILPSRRIEVANTPAGRSIVNITHEIAHAAASKNGCGCHDKNWILAYLKIAERYEARFPGRKWSGQKPTQRVLRNLARFNIKM